MPRPVVTFLSVTPGTSSTFAPASFSSNPGKQGVLFKMPITPRMLGAADDQFLFPDRHQNGWSSCERLVSGQI